MGLWSSLRSLGDTNHHSHCHSTAALASVQHQCSRKSKSLLLPLQMVGSEGSVPVTSLTAGRVLGLVLLWYKKHLFCEYDSGLNLMSVFISVGNFLRNVP